MLGRGSEKCGTLMTITTRSPGLADEDGVPCVAAFMGRSRLKEGSASCSGRSGERSLRTMRNTPHSAIVTGATHMATHANHKGSTPAFAIASAEECNNQ